MAQSNEYQDPGTEQKKNERPAGSGLLTGALGATDIEHRPAMLGSFFTDRGQKKSGQPSAADIESKRLRKEKSLNAVNFIMQENEAWGNFNRASSTPERSFTYKEEGNDEYKDAKLRMLETQPKLFWQIYDAYNDPQNPLHDKVGTPEKIMSLYNSRKDLFPDVSMGERFFDILSAFPKAFAYWSWKSNPKFYEDRKYGVGQGQYAESETDFFSSMPGMLGIATIAGGAIGGNLALPGGPGAYLGGTAFPAIMGQAVAFAAGDAPLPFSPGTDYEWEHFWEGLTGAVGFGPRYKTMQAENWSQILGPDAGNMAAYYEFTMLDPFAETLGFGLAAGIGKVVARMGVKRIAKLNKDLEALGLPPNFLDNFNAPKKDTMAEGKAAKRAALEGVEKVEAFREKAGDYAVKWDDIRQEQMKYMKRIEKAPFTKSERKAARELYAEKPDSPFGEINAEFADGSTTTIYPNPAGASAAAGEANVNMILQEAPKVLEPSSDLIEEVARKEVGQVAKSGDVVLAPQQLSEASVKEFALEKELFAGKALPPALRGSIDNVRQYVALKFGPNSILWEEIIAPAIYGIGRAGRDGIMAFDRNLSAKGKLLQVLARRAGIGHFRQSTHPVGEGAIRAGRYVTSLLDSEGWVFKGAASEKRSRAIIDAIQTSDEAVAALPVEQREFANVVKDILDDYLKQINIRRKAVLGANAKDVTIAKRENYFPHMFALSYFDGKTHDLAKMSDETIDALNSFLERSRETPYEFIDDGTKAAEQQKAWLEKVGAPTELVEKSRFKNHFFPPDMPWFGNLLPRLTDQADYNRNIMAVMGKYMAGAEQVVSLAVPAARAEKAFNQLHALGHIDDATYKYLTEWKDETLLNRQSASDAIWQSDEPGFINTAARWYSKAVQRTARNLIPGSMTFAMQNIWSFPNVFMVKGIRASDVARGYGKSTFFDLTPALKRVVGNISDKEITDGINGAFGEYGIFRQWNELEMGTALRESQVMQQRADVGWERLGAETLQSGDMYKLYTGIIDVSDQYVVGMAYHSGKRAAKREAGIMRARVDAGTMELPRWFSQRYGAPPTEGAAKNEWWDEAIEFYGRAYGDDLAGDTQAIYHPAMMSPLQRKAWFRMVAPFQTYITQMSSFTRDSLFGSGSGRAAIWDQYTPGDKLGTAMKLFGAMAVANSLARTTGIKPPFEASTFTPAGENLLTMFDITDAPNRGSSLLVINNYRKMWAGVGSFLENGFDFNDASQRAAIEAGLISIPDGAGLQWGVRGLLHLADRYQGGIELGVGKGGKREFLRFKAAQRNKALGVGRGLGNIGSGVAGDPLGFLQGVGFGTKKMRDIRGQKTQWRDKSERYSQTVFPSVNLLPVKGERPINAGLWQPVLEKVGVPKKYMKDYGDQ